MSVRRRHEPKLKALIKSIPGAMLISASMILLCHTHRTSASDDSAMMGVLDEPLYESVRNSIEQDSSESPYNFGDRYPASHAKSSTIKARSIAIQLMRPFFTAPRLETASLSSSTNLSDKPSPLPPLVEERINVPDKDAATRTNRTEEMTPDSPVDPETSSSHRKLLQHSGDGSRNKSMRTAPIKSRALPREDSVSMSESKQIERNSECALILKRTYILTDPNSDEWGEKFVFNEADEDNK